MKKMILLLAVVFTLISTSAVANDLVFVAGDVKIILDKNDVMYCSNCGYGEQFVPIKGPAPMFTGISGPDAYFRDRFLIIVRTDMGTSCPAGDWYAIDLQNRTSRKLELPNCDETAVSYTSSKGKVTVVFTQGKKVKKFSF